MPAPQEVTKMSQKYAHDMNALTLFEVTDPLGFDEIQISDFASAFRISDIVGDGLITYKEVPRVLARVGEFPSAQTLEKIMNNDIDPEGNGVYDFQTFLKLMKHFHHEPATAQVLLEAFKLFDQDESGTVEAGELKHCLSALGDKMSNEEAEEMISMADKNNNGCISYDEFLDFIGTTY
mmetsp:Transcript_26677/g.67216  ORF Transcript_26677/g.67216 Transcript_26677/m.67216 type:complete len:179 (+) Transcript_26677:137-673(+)|eukprot:CAMPEP_0178993062 /NCGR_PEP_ID=MMETSP0795-20121207/6483_1 /TAXON_ID=88552 /ORGANISM="Amoebophrya sp., Strain Ameob2" /LENGTH=178 /DNA_ID=CAMNT_0020685057 /DNA_START=126 /DNA_END=662 /DNA_ORIENTATION=+